MAHGGAAREAAVEAMTREWAQRWEPDGISAVALALGRFDTESLHKYPEELTRGAARSVPLGRMGEPREFGWLAASRLAAGPRPERQHDHARRRRRRLVGPVARPR